MKTKSAIDTTATTNQVLLFDSEIQGTIIQMSINFTTVVTFIIIH